MKRILISILIFASAAAVILVQGPNSGAADRDLTRPSFDLNCGVTEPEFYAWVEVYLWQKPRPFEATLTDAIDALVSSPEWTIRLPKTPCAKFGMSQAKRERLLFMIDDAQTEGAGSIEFTKNEGENERFATQFSF